MAKTKPKKKTAKAKPKAEEVRYDTPEALAKYDATTHREMCELKQAMRNHRTAYLDSKERTADLKKQYEASRINYEDAFEERERYRGKKPPGVQLTIQMTDTTEGDDQAPSGGSIPGWVPKELWREFPIDRLQPYGLTPSDAQKLREGKVKGSTKAIPIITVGDMSDFSQPWPSDPTRNYQLTDVKGIGAECAKRIDDALDRFWKEWDAGKLCEAFAKEKGHNPPAETNDEAIANAGSGHDAGGGDKAGSKPKRTRKPAEPTDGEEPATVPFERPTEPEPAPAEQQAEVS